MSRRRVILFVADGHRDDLLRAELCPNLSGFADAGRRFRAHTSNFPSATRASAASIATGCWPGTHGLHGNTMGLPGAGGTVIHDVGDPAFVAALRQAFGRTLKVPTLAERLAGHGGALIASNVSPGAAYFHDPDGHGHVVHRAGSFGPGRRPLGPDEAPVVSHDAAGDMELTRWFCNRMQDDDGPVLGVLWLCDPDLSMLADALGPDRHLAGIAAADACFAHVRATTEALSAAGDDILLIVCSDHGQESVAGHVAIADELVAARLKDSPTSTEVAIAPQGGSGLVYATGAGLARIDAIAAFLAAHPRVGEVFAGPALRVIGQAEGDGLVIAFSMARDDTLNPHGVPGRIWVCTSDSKPGKPVGRGSHGGLGAWERHPFLIVAGGGFAPGSEETGQTRLIDIAPTILRHLRLPRGGMDGLALPFD